MVSKSAAAKYTAPRLPIVTDRLRTPACSAVAASAIGSGASIVISSSFTCMKSKDEHHSRTLGIGRNVRAPSGWIAHASMWRSQ